MVVFYFLQPHLEVQELVWYKRRLGFEQYVILQGKTVQKGRSRFALLAVMKALSISVLPYEIFSINTF